MTTPDKTAESSDTTKSHRNYWRFGAMILTAMVVMFALTYINTYEASHIHWSETRFYMTLLMGAAMAVIMLSFMLGQHQARRINIGIFALSAVLFIGATWLVRSQATVDESSYMSAMIPHHSIAILTSERANIEDVRVRELAGEIIAAQEREIAEMEWLIEDIAENGGAHTSQEASSRPVPDFGG